MGIAPYKCLPTVLCTVKNGAGRCPAPWGSKLRCVRCAAVEQRLALGVYQHGKTGGVAVIMEQVLHAGLVSTQISLPPSRQPSSRTLTKRPSFFFAIAYSALSLSSSVLALAARPASPWISLGIMILVALPSAIFCMASSAFSLMT